MSPHQSTLTIDYALTCIQSSLDKNVFKDGLAKLQSSFEQRFYTTTLAFAHDLCEVVHVGINAPRQSDSLDQPRFEAIDVSPTKQNSYSEARDRKRLGKRILKSVQPQLEVALKAEAEVTSKTYENLRKELEGMIDASLEIRQVSNLQSQQETAQASQDIAMTDAPEEAHITVAEEAGEKVTAEPVEGMDVDELSIEVKDEDTGETTGGVAPEMRRDNETTEDNDAKAHLEGVKPAPTPPDTNGYMSVTQSSIQPTPLTPPQSNGSLSHGTDNVLTEGGILWYLKPFEIEGTTAVEEQWAGRDAVRSLSEELTDMDDEELNDLEFNVEDSTITASPVNAIPPEGPSGTRSRRKAGTGLHAHAKKRLRSSARRR